jgi:hypothetical protein
MATLILIDWLVTENCCIFSLHLLDGIGAFVWGGGDFVSIRFGRHQFVAKKPSNVD